MPQSCPLLGAPWLLGRQRRPSRERQPAPSFSPPRPAGGSGQGRRGGPARERQPASSFSPAGQSAVWAQERRQGAPGSTCQTLQPSTGSMLVGTALTQVRAAQPAPAPRRERCAVAVPPREPRESRAL